MHVCRRTSLWLFLLWLTKIAQGQIINGRRVLETAWIAQIFVAGSGLVAIKARGNEKNLD